MVNHRFFAFIQIFVYYNKSWLTVNALKYGFVLKNFTDTLLLYRKISYIYFREFYHFLKDCEYELLCCRILGSCFGK